MIYLIISFCLSFGVLEEILKVLWDLEKQIHTVNRRINGGCGTAFVGVSTNPPFWFDGFGGFDEFIELNTNPPFWFDGFDGFNTNPPPEVGGFDEFDEFNTNPPFWFDGFDGFNTSPPVEVDGFDGLKRVSLGCGCATDFSMALSKSSTFQTTVNHQLNHYYRMKRNPLFLENAMSVWY